MPGEGGPPLLDTIRLFRMHIAAHRRAARYRSPRRIKGAICRHSEARQLPTESGRLCYTDRLGFQCPVDARTCDPELLDDLGWHRRPDRAENAAERGLCCFYDLSLPLLFCRVLWLSPHRPHER